MPRKTLHVLPRDGGWTVTREGEKKHRVFPTQKEAIENAKVIVKQESSGQVVVYGRNGMIRQRHTYGMPRILNPPGKKSARIEKAIDKITRDRLQADPLPSRG